MKVPAVSTLICLTASAVAHSWLHCTNHDNHEILEWMKTNATVNGKDHVIDPLMPWFADLCHGWPRAKKNPGDWVDESSNYIWDIQDTINRKDTHACHPSQRSATQYLSVGDPTLKYHENPAPMATSRPGQSIKLMFGGNGHARGAPFTTTGNPGKVAVYWKGTRETEITDVKDFKEEYLLQENGFSDESFAFPADLNVKTPEQGLYDKGNWMTLKMPECMEKGRHMMVWVWSFEGLPRFSTCFDVMIQ